MTTGHRASGGRDHARDGTGEAMTDIQDGITETESYSPDWKSIRVAAAVIVAAILAVVWAVL